MTVECSQNFIGLFAISTAVACHILSKIHLNLEIEWYKNKWFWAGLFGNLPALVALLGRAIKEIAAQFSGQLTEEASMLCKMTKGRR